MKKIFGFAAILLCMNSIAAERSMTLFANNNFLGSYLDIYDDYHLNEKPEVQNASGQYVLSDYLLPVGTSNTSSVQMMNGYCGILASQAHFAGTWQLLNPGDHASLGSFDNLTQSIATYKMIGQQQTACNPKQDIPTLYSGTSQTGTVYPLVTNNGYRAQGVFAGQATNLIVLHSNHRSARKSVNGVLVASGGFSDKAESLKVPACYNVKLVGTNSNLQAVSSTFAPGTYNLTSYGLAKNLAFATVTRQANCIQPKQITTLPSACTTPGLQVHGGFCANSANPAFLTNPTFISRCGAGCSLEFRNIGWTSRCPNVGAGRSPEYGVFCK